MISNVAKCGCDCVNCPTYKDNIMTTEDRMICSAGWKKHLNINLSPEKLRPCDGCSIPDPQRKTYYLNCKVRKCAIINGVKNCAFCAGFPCEELLAVHSLQQISTREEFIEKTGKEISETHYKLFVEPYTGLKNLKQIRETLSKDDIKDYKKFAIKVKSSPVGNSDNIHESDKIIHTLLTSLFVEKDISFARLQTLRKKREQLMKILWSMARYGVLNENTDYLELDAKTFLSQKIQGMYSTLLGYFDELKNQNIHCEIVPFTEKGWLTPMGGLRKEGWVVRMTFGKSLNGTATLKRLQDYVRILDEKYGKSAARFFNIADLSIMSNT